MKKWLKETIPYIIILLVVILVRTFIVTPIAVNGPSMQETLYTNDIMLLYKLGDIKKYDIVVAKISKNNGTEKLIKRIMATPGETIKCEDGIIYINGEKDESGYGYGTSFDFKEVTLGEDEYFIMGDNREDSYDSRYFGPVKKEQILGHTNLIIFPFNRIKKVN